MRAGFWLDDWLTRRDGDGRCLLEQAAPGYQAGLNSACPYSDSRLGASMNSEALEQVQRHWGAVCRQVHQLTPARATLQQAFQVSLELVSPPLLRDCDPVPVSEAVTYKACIGFCQVFCWLVMADDAAGHQPLSEFGEASSFFAWLDAGGWLRGSQQVCAGSNDQISALYRLFCHGSGTSLKLSPVLQAVALQAALLLATREAMGRGEALQGSWSHRMLTQGRAPWLYAVTARPQAQPEWARRLLPAGHTSGVLESFLHNQTHRDREALALELLAEL